MSIGIDIQLKRLNLLVTKRCNLRCKMCDYRVIHFAEAQLKLDKILGLIQDAAALGVKQLELSGGEPMVRQDIYEIMSYAKSFDIDTMLMTNGTLIGETEVEKLLESGLKSVVISLEGFEAVNDAIRGLGNFHKALGALQHFVKFKNRLDYVKVGVTITRFNYKQLYDFTRFLFEDIGVNSISFNPFCKDLLHESNRSRTEDLAITEDMLTDLRAELDRVKAYSRTASGSFQPDSYLNRIPGYFLGESMIPQVGCIQPLTSCAVINNGDTFACFGEYVPVGNIYESSLKEIVKGEKYREICDKALSGKCRGCLSSCYGTIFSDEIEELKSESSIG